MCALHALRAQTPLGLNAIPWSEWFPPGAPPAYVTPSATTHLATSDAAVRTDTLDADDAGDAVIDEAAMDADALAQTVAGLPVECCDPNHATCECLAGVVHAF